MVRDHAGNFGLMLVQFLLTVIISASCSSTVKQPQVGAALRPVARRAAR